MSKIPPVTFEYLLGALPIKGRTNTYHGSVALAENAGLFDDAFRYRITLSAEKMDDDDKKIVAEWYLGWQSYDTLESDPSSADKLTRASFEASEEGAAAANRWLNEALAAVQTR